MGEGRAWVWDGTPGDGAGMGGVVGGVVGRDLTVQIPHPDFDIATVVFANKHERKNEIQFCGKYGIHRCNMN